MSQIERPVNLDLTQFHFPPMAIVSILHRITGVLIFLFLPLMLYLLHQAYLSQVGYDSVIQLLKNGWMKFFVWAMLSAVCFHLIAGIRHLIMDCGIGESLKGGRNGAYLVFALSAVMAVITGVWIW